MRSLSFVVTLLISATLTTGDICMAQWHPRDKADEAEMYNYDDETPYPPRGTPNPGGWVCFGVVVLFVGWVIWSSMTENQKPGKKRLSDK